MAPAINSLPPFLPGDVLRADNLEALRRECLRTAALPVGADHNLLYETWLGIIDSTGYTDYTDERYWVKRLYCSNTDDDSTTALTLTALSDTDPPYRRVTATNLKELTAGTHFLTAGKYVWIHKVRDRSEPPVERWVFDQAIDVHPAVATDDYNSGTSPPTVDVQLCADWAGGSPHGDTLTCLLPYTSGNFPNVRSGDVLGVLPYEHGTEGYVVAVTGYLDDPIGTIKAWDGEPGAVPAGWEITAAGRFIVGYEESHDYFDPKDNTGGYVYHGQTENNHLAHVDHTHPFSCAWSCSTNTGACSLTCTATLGSCSKSCTLPHHCHTQCTGEGGAYNTTKTNVDANLDGSTSQVVCAVTGISPVYTGDENPTLVASIDINHSHSIDLGSHTHSISVGGTMNGNTGTEDTVDTTDELRHGGALNNGGMDAQCGDTLNLPPFIVKRWIVRVN